MRLRLPSLRFGEVIARSRLRPINSRSVYSVEDTLEADVVFIDWVSSWYHNSFNQSLFEALGKPAGTFYFYSEEMQIHEGRICYRNVGSGRLFRAMDVVRLCRSLRGKTVFFLTYDPFFLPLLQFLNIGIAVYEHNTTPEPPRFWKHAAWQTVFLRRFTRLAQFPGQFDVLRSLGQRVIFVGSPLPPAVSMKNHSPTIYLAPSDRVVPSELLKLAPFIQGVHVVVRSHGFSRESLALLKQQLPLEVVDYIDVDVTFPLCKAIIIAIDSAIRGSGWFNDAIRYGIPIIITSPNVQELFERTFPGYPYIKCQDISSPEDLNYRLEQTKYFDRFSYISSHNANLGEVVLSNISCISKPKSRSKKLLSRRNRM